MEDIVFKSGDVIPCGSINPKSFNYITFINRELKGFLSADIELHIDGREGLITGFDIYYNTRKNVESCMDIDIRLTKKIQIDFDKGYESGHWGDWIDWIEKWLEKKGYKPNISDSTSDPRYEGYNGEHYDFVSFSGGRKDKDGVVIIWEKEPPIVYVENMSYSFEDILSGEFMDEYLDREEIAYHLGYNGDFEALNEDFQRQYFEKCLNKPISEFYRKRRSRFIK
jgi:hypothetical protein